MSEAAALSLPQVFPYAERPDRRETWLDRAWTRLAGVVVMQHAALTGRRCGSAIAEVNAIGSALRTLSDAELRQRILVLRHRLRLAGLDAGPIREAFAHIREASARVLGMRHFDVQVQGALALLAGRFAEMATGEGKSLTATLAAAAAGLAGIPVHVVTVNDYLAQRDAAELAPIYEFLGLSVGLIVHEKTPEQRRSAYACDVVYCTNKELVFDYLRDRVIRSNRRDRLRLKIENLLKSASSSQRLLLRGLHFAIVDEADSVLVDEARTPLILSSMSDSLHDVADLEQALSLIENLAETRHYRLFTDERRVVLTEAGKRQVERLTEELGGAWRARVVREELVRLAIKATHLYRRDEHYLVKDGKIAIVDEYTGRVMPDRHWGEGLHQMIEMKEGCEISGRHVTLARITYQRFFRRYRRLAGMSGTAKEVAEELWSVYRLPVMSIPTNRPLRRRAEGDRIFADADSKWEAITDEVRRMHATGRPVLLGTRSVAAAEIAARHLDRAQLPYCLLSAAQDENEAQVVAEAGQPARITIATNMAGRGTDIKLAAGVADAGGLHVIVSERHEAARIDRQLAGRCGRQGDPGSFRAILSLDDPLLDNERLLLNRRVTKALFPVLGEGIGRIALRRAQKAAERLHSRIRKDLLRVDRARSDAMGFTGVHE